MRVKFFFVFKRNYFWLVFLSVRFCIWIWNYVLSLENQNLSIFFNHSIKVCNFVPETSSSLFPNKKIKNSNEDLLGKVMLFLQRLFFCARVNCQRVSYFSWRLRFLRISSLAVRLSNYEFTSHRSKMQIISRNGPKLRPDVLQMELFQVKLNAKFRKWLFHFSFCLKRNQFWNFSFTR